MFEVFLLMIAAAAQGAGSVSTVSTHSVTVPRTAPSAVSPPDVIAPATAPTSAPAFLAPAPSGDQAASAPAFLAPATDQAAAPAFLAPAPKAAAAAPAFLAPAVKPATNTGLVAEPQTPTGRFTTATEVKPILTATQGNWILVREFDGKDLLYVTHLWAWRCGLVEMRVGINGNAPKVWPLPECHMDQPSPGAILDGDGLPYGEFALGSIAMVEVELTYDDLSTDSAKFNRQGMVIP